MKVCHLDIWQRRESVADALHPFDSAPGIDEMMMYLLEAENEAESRKRPAKRNLDELQADQAEGDAKRQKKDDEPGTQ